MRIAEIFHTGCGGRNNYDHHGGGGYGGGWGSYGHRSGYRNKNRDHGGCGY
jgi:hypothetical protein